MVKKIAEHPLPTVYGDFTLTGFLSENNSVILALRTNTLDPNRFLLRVQFGCVNATVFGATDCDCGAQIQWSLTQIQMVGSGVFIYFPNHEGHGIGLERKLRAAQVEKSTKQSFWKVLGNFGLSSLELRRLDKDALTVLPDLLKELSVRGGAILLTNSEEKVRACRAAGIKIGDVIPIHLEDRSI
jgi:3,4-dihydroxy 2-butanone 4-phosphate synthase/GTP cyclohydrolase II